MDTSRICQKCAVVGIFASTSRLSLIPAATSTRRTQFGLAVSPHSAGRFTSLLNLSIALILRCNRVSMRRSTCVQSSGSMLPNITRQYQGERASSQQMQVTLSPHIASRFISLVLRGSSASRKYRCIAPMPNFCAVAEIWAEIRIGA